MAVTDNMLREIKGLSPEQIESIKRDRDNSLWEYHRNKNLKYHWRHNRGDFIAVTMILTMLCVPLTFGIGCFVKIVFELIVILIQGIF